MKLLTLANPKTQKGEKYGYLTAVLHLSPSNISGFNVCPMATAGCRSACLNTAGQGGFLKGTAGKCGLDVVEGIKNGHYMNNVQRARLRRTIMFFEDREAFMTQLADEIENEIKRAKSYGLIPVFRLNATSDIRWENYSVTHRGVRYENVMSAFPDIQFYDYTKIPNRRVSHIPNYHLTFSLAEDNDEFALKAVQNGLNVAVVFRKEFPKTFMGLKVVDGDDSDLRFLDNRTNWIHKVFNIRPQSVVVGLKAKGKARMDTTGFVREGKVK